VSDCLGAIVDISDLALSKLERGTAVPAPLYPIDIEEQWTRLRREHEAEWIALRECDLHGGEAAYAELFFIALSSGGGVACAGEDAVGVAATPASVAGRREEGSVLILPEPRSSSASNEGRHASVTTLPRSDAFVGMGHEMTRTRVVSQSDVRPEGTLWLQVALEAAAIPSSTLDNFHDPSAWPKPSIGHGDVDRRFEYLRHQAPELLLLACRIS
jgi:hypothetical protein